MVLTELWLGDQSSNALALSGAATRRGGSPSRRGPSVAVTPRWVTVRAASMTSRTDTPVPVPKLSAWDAIVPSISMRSAVTCASARSVTCT